MAAAPPPPPQTQFVHDPRSPRYLTPTAAASLAAIESPDNPATVSRVFGSLRLPDFQSYDQEDQQFLRQWATDAAVRGGSAAAIAAISTVGFIRFMKFEYLTPMRTAFLSGAVSVMAGLTGALTISPDRIRQAMAIPRQDSKLRREVSSMVLKRNPNYFLDVSQANKNRKGVIYINPAANKNNSETGKA